MKSIALITSSLDPRTAPDDQPLERYFVEKGLSCVPMAWDNMRPDWKSFDAFLIRSCWNYHRQPGPFTAWLKTIQDSGIAVLNPVSTVLWNLNKQYLKELRDKGVAIPPTLWLDQNPPGDRDWLSEILAAQSWEKAVIKPCISATSYLTMTVTPETAPDTAGKIGDVEMKGGMIIQEFQPELVESGEYSFIFFDNDYSHSVLKKAKPGEFRVQNQFGGTAVRTFPSADLITQAKSVLEVIEQRHIYARVDAFVLRGKLVVMEVELIEPVLFLGANPGSARVLGDCVLAQI